MKKNIYTLLILLSFYTAQSQNKLNIEFKEIGYGLTSSEVLVEQKLENSPSQKHLTTDFSANLKKQTDSIPAKIGTQFAIVYKLKAKNSGLIPVNIVWKYPKGMKDNNGKELTETSYVIQKETNIETYSNYTLEGDNELIKGTWTFQMFIGEKILYEKEFYLY